MMLIAAAKPKPASESRLGEPITSLISFAKRKLSSLVRRGEARAPTADAGNAFSFSAVLLRALSHDTGFWLTSGVLRRSGEFR